ncbi:MAG: antibiotic biosynthesis monooxygenase [Candidatus Tectimicrobiota bacterium]
MIRVIYRWKVQPGAEDIFVQAWTQGTRAIQAMCKGARGSFLLRDQLAPTEFIGIACWDSVEDCQLFWRGPRPDPEAARIVAEVSTRVSRLIFDEVQDLSLPALACAQALPTAA